MKNETETETENIIIFRKLNHTVDMYVRWIIVAADIRCAVSGHRFVLEVRPRSRASDARSQHGDVGVVAEISQ